MKDMVVHMDPFWDKYSRLKPYLQPKDADADHATERRVSPEDMKKLVAVANCVMCATCYALCPVVSVDPAFAGPAAIAYAYRFIEDVRDGQRSERIAQISEDYLWLCAHCYACSYCPKHVDPQRSHHRRQARGDQRRVMMNERGPRHALVVVEDDQADRHAGRNRSHSRHRRPLQHQRSAQGHPARLAHGRPRQADAGEMAVGGTAPMWASSQKPIPKVDEVRTIFESLEVPV